MKPVGVAGTVALLLLLGTTAPVYAQHEQQGGQQDKSREQQHQPARSAQQQHQPSAQQAHPSAAPSPIRSRRRGRSLKRGHSRATAAPITAASVQTALLTAASITAACRRKNSRCATVSASLARDPGTANTAPGRSAEDMPATAYLKNAFGSTTGVTTTSASIPFRLSSWAGIHGSSMTAIGSPWLTPGRRHGRRRGIKPTRYTSTIPTMGTTYMTLRARGRESQ